MKTAPGVVSVGAVKPEHEDLFSLPAQLFVATLQVRVCACVRAMPVCLRVHNGKAATIHIF